MGGVGDDTLVVADSTFFVVNGGTGVDQLSVLSGNLDVTAKGASNFVSSDSIVLSSGSAQTLGISHTDIATITGDVNTRVGLTYQTANTLVVEGKAGDTLELNGTVGTDWFNRGTTTVDGSGSFTVYEHNSDGIYVVVKGVGTVQ
jgi:mannose-6-phosphate isomerase-like protein (cupin superfamily)